MKKYMTALLLSALLLVGCEKKEAQPTTSTSSSAISSQSLADLRQTALPTSTSTSSTPPSSMVESQTKVIGNAKMGYLRLPKAAKEVTGLEKHKDMEVKQYQIKDGEIFITVGAYDIKTYTDYMKKHKKELSDNLLETDILLSSNITVVTDNYPDAEIEAYQDSYADAFFDSAKYQTKIKVDGETRYLAGAAFRPAKNNSKLYLITLDYKAEKNLNSDLDALVYSWTANKP